MPAQWASSDITYLSPDQWMMQQHYTVSPSPSALGSEKEDYFQQPAQSLNTWYFCQCCASSTLNLVLCDQCNAFADQGTFDDATGFESIWQ
ncbi:hypothetical protein LTR42_012471 [Elasticomyces elasticus]|nr:hypothetical protein LTR42_012471 [Elasticomyces elasticus]